tara:strand:+ start:267 stop:440 length:174 start_codon:yes stop_codon:yes gene_type:complete
MPDQAIKNPDTEVSRLLRTLTLFSGIFNVARNPVTNRHKRGDTPAKQRGQQYVKFEM